MISYPQHRSPHGHRPLTPPEHRAGCCQVRGMETYNGHVRTPADAIILFEACRLGLLPRTQRRLSEKERQSIKPGSVFVWDEREAGMRRWTDGKSWSASRVSGSFLTYREMEGKRGGSTFDKNQARDAGNEGESDGGPEGYRYKADGLIKQSFSITRNDGVHLHLISYYSRSLSAVQSLLQPTSDPQLRHIRPEKGLYPESTVPEQSTISAASHGTPPTVNENSATLGPPAVDPYTHSPGQPAAPFPRHHYGHPPWSPPSPMRTPPQQSSYSSSHPAPPPASYAHHQSSHTAPYPPQHHHPPGPTALDRPPPPLSSHGLPPLGRDHYPPPPTYHNPPPYSESRSYNTVPALTHPYPPPPPPHYQNRLPRLGEPESGLPPPHSAPSLYPPPPEVRHRKDSWQSSPAREPIPPANRLPPPLPHDYRQPSSISPTSIDSTHPPKSAYHMTNGSTPTSTSPNGPTIPSISSMLNDDTGKDHSKGMSGPPPPPRLSCQLQDIPSHKLGFEANRDVQALRNLDRTTFKYN